jgi:hypothetical protein
MNLDIITCVQSCARNHVCKQKSTIGDLTLTCPTSGFFFSFPLLDCAVISTRNEIFQSIALFGYVLQYSITDLDDNISNADDTTPLLKYFWEFLDSRSFVESDPILASPNLSESPNIPSSPWLPR